MSNRLVMLSVSQSAKTDAFKLDWFVIVIKTGERKKTVTSGDL